MKKIGPKTKDVTLTIEEEIEVLNAQIEEERILHGDYLDDPYIVIPCDEY